MRLPMLAFLRLAAALFVATAAATAAGVPKASSPVTAAAPASASLAAGAPKAPSAPAFVSGERLQANLESKDVVLLDARPLRDFLASHLHGARSVAVENLRSTSGGVPATTYPADVLGVILARAGVTRASHVVVYGAESDVDATYVATVARIAGAERVSVLDGGFSRWMADGRPATKDRELASSERPNLKGDPSPLIPIEDVLKRVGDGKTVFLDVRLEEQWAAGRIPGAKNRFWKKDVVDGSFRPAEEIRAEMEAAGVSWERPVVVYCNSGHQASEGLYMLRYRLAHPDARLYQGSWLEWSMTPGTPRETSAPAEVK